MRRSRGCGATPSGGQRAHRAVGAGPDSDAGAGGELAGAPGLVLVAGRYEGIDERVLESEVDLEVSIGDYVVSGGELPALVLIDALARLQPGALGDERSSAEESFSAGLLDWPHYTRPEQYQADRVPAVLSRAITARFAAGGSSKRWAGPGCEGANCWPASRSMRSARRCCRNF